MQPDNSPYAVPVQSDGPDCTPIYRAVEVKDMLVSRFPPPRHEIQSTHDNFEYTAKEYPQVACLGARSLVNGQWSYYKWMTYQQVATLRTAIGSGLYRFGLHPGSTVGLYSVNCPQWILCDLACSAYSMVTVPLYDTLGPDAVQYICAHANVQCVMCSVTVLQNVIDILEHAQDLKVVVVWGISSHELASQYPPNSLSRKCDLVTLEEVQRLGGQDVKQHVPPKSEQVATICYTSGTTGVPKGAVLTHQNIVSVCAGACGSLSEVGGLLPIGATYLSYLPLAHIYERVLIVAMFHYAASIGFYRGDVTLLLDDITQLRPMFFASVPRVWNRFHDRITQQINASGRIASSLFYRALAYRLRRLEVHGDLSGGVLGSAIDAMIFNKIRDKLGGNLKFITTGASPIQPAIYNFTRLVICNNFLQGYGLTESSGVATQTRRNDVGECSVGAPALSCEIKLVDIPEMGYTHADSPFPRGELCVRGPSIFQGYHKAPELTREVLDEQGWLHTGDVALVKPNGVFQIIDRKKNLFKLAQGEYVAPEKIENVYLKCPLIQQIFVYGDSLRSKLIAIVVPDPEAILSHPILSKQFAPPPGKAPAAGAAGAAGAAPAAHLARVMEMVPGHTELAHQVFKEMDLEGQRAKLLSYEKVFSVRCVGDVFSVENGLLTPTMKLKRNVARDWYKSVIEEMYKEINE